MNITNVQSTSGIESLTGSGLSQNVLGKDDFLMLLVAQLQNQDPLNPADSTEYTAQLAQFSQLEATYNIDQNLTDLRVEQIAQSQIQSVAYIGKQVTAADNSLVIADGNPETVNFELADNANEVYVSIYDASGNLVDTFKTGPQTAGQQSVSWQALDSQGRKLPDGTYTVDLQAVDVNDESVPVRPLVIDQVTGVNIGSGVTYLVTANRQIPMSLVVEVNDG